MPVQYGQERMGRLAKYGHDAEGLGADMDVLKPTWKASERQENIWMAPGTQCEVGKESFIWAVFTYHSWCGLRSKNNQLYRTSNLTYKKIQQARSQAFQMIPDAKEGHGSGHSLLGRATVLRTINWNPTINLN